MSKPTCLRFSLALCGAAVALATWSCADNTPVADYGAHPAATRRAPGTSTPSPGAAMSPGASASATPTPSDTGNASTIPGNIPTQTPFATLAPTPTPTPSPTATPSVVSVQVLPQALTLNAPSLDGKNTAGLATTATVQAQVAYGNGRMDGSVTWSASPQGIVTVAPQGGGLATVTAIATGQAIVSAVSAIDATHLATASVTVQGSGALGITLD